VVAGSSAVVSVEHNCVIVTSAGAVTVTKLNLVSAVMKVNELGVGHVDVAVTVTVGRVFSSQHVGVDVGYGVVCGLVSV